ncbi:hypothetical protein [Ammoniphilus sp. CFH 90114]|uniref:hypothetical protein n=1 Tax=Ammoniphilus sp. CFH 90114 TaxID=2493665 RepID=UPI00102638AB|nr:hypothetical protein [Ammoniphilus sp. CFH 90114]RXT01947.1 hypothetical protein EIZ39_25245 [Ammoniphilus sp. CFH 90114]
MNSSPSDTVINRSRGNNQLLIILAGYKDYLWNMTLFRIAKFAPKDMDICIASSGIRSKELMKYAEKFNWSYVETKRNDPGFVQNLAIQVHPRAHWIYKLDEDHVIAENFFESLHQGYISMLKTGLKKPGFISPLVNVHVNTYVEFLKKINKDQEYFKKFGELSLHPQPTKAHYDGVAAKWLWMNSLPFDAVAKQLNSLPFGYTIVNHRFSIGSILFERDFWKRIGGMAVVKEDGERVGKDESYLCKQCLELQRPIVFIHNVFAGHYSYGPQNDVMKNYLNILLPHLSI